MSVIVKIFGETRCIFSSLFLSLTALINNCYAQQPTILSQLFDRDVQPWEAMTLLSGVFLVLISPKKYRTKLAGIVTAIIVIYSMIIVINIASDIEIH